MEERRRVGLPNRPGRHKTDTQCDEREHRDWKEQPNTIRTKRHDLDFLTTPNVAHSTPFPTITKKLVQRIEGNGLARQTFGMVNGRHPRRTTMGRLVLL